MARQRRSEAFRVAFDLRQEFRARGEFTQTEYVDSLRPALDCFREQAYEGFVQHVAEKVDKESARERDDSQPDLPGIGSWDLGGEYHLPGTRRVAKRLSRFEDAEEAMALDDANLLAVQEANMRKRKEMLALRSYWHRPGVTKQEAVNAYQADHTGEAS